MARGAQERGMDEEREQTARTRDKNTDRHAGRYSGAFLGVGGHITFWACPNADISRDCTTPHLAP